MERKSLETIKALEEHLKKETFGINTLDLSDLKIHFSLSTLDLYKEIRSFVNVDAVNHLTYVNSINFDNLEFLGDVELNHNLDLNFDNSIFQNDLTISSSHSFEKILQFSNCSFNEFRIKHATFNSQLYFSDCEFFGKFIVSDSNFNEPFFLSKIMFKKNVLFPFSNFKNICSFKQVQFVRGLDISSTRFLGGFDFSNCELVDFDAISIIGQTNMETIIDVIEEGLIPRENKRGTFRLLKQKFRNDHNRIEELNYEYLEKRTFLEEVTEKLFSNRYSASKFNKNRVQLLGDFFILKLNKWSNEYKTSLFSGIKFTLIVSILFFYLSMLATERYSFDWSIDVYWDDIFKNFFAFFNPVHKPNYLGPEFTQNYNLSLGFYIFDFLGRIFVGYGIYQTIQAFRKYR